MTDGSIYGNSTTNPSPGYRLARNALVLTALCLILWAAGAVVLMWFAGLLIAVALRAVSRFVQRATRLGGTASLTVTVLSFLALCVGAALVLGPRVAEQMDAVYGEVTASAGQLASNLERYEWGRWLLDRIASLDSESTNQGPAILSRAAEAAGGLVSAGANAFAFVIISSAIGVYLAAGFSGYVNGLIRLVRPDKRRRIREAFDVSLIALEGWMRGIVVSMTVLGVCSYIGLSLLGIPLAMALALLTAALTFIPNFGPFISVIPPVLLALGDNPMTAVYVIAFYIVLQNAEGLVITPLVQRRTAAIPPPLLLGVQVLMGALLGFLGLLFAAPLCAFAIVWVKLLYLEGRLKEHVEVAGHTSRC